MMAEVLSNNPDHEEQIVEFAAAWQVEITETDGNRTYPVTAHRLELEGRGYDWRLVARLSTTALDRVLDGIQEPIIR